MTRTKRMQRVAALLESRERIARADLAAATLQAKAADEALEEVFKQCRRVAENSDELSIRFGRALIESGWLAAEERQGRQLVAHMAAEERHVEWRNRRSRVDALVQLVDRLQEADRAETERREANELDDRINARRRLVGVGGPGPEGPVG